jgi:phosphatidylinositol glycan class B
VLIAGSLSWLWFVGRVGSRPIATVLAGVSGVLVASLFIDRWGYGVWAFPPYEYLRVNLVEQAAARYGTYPFYAYLYAMLPNPFAPVVLLMILALLVCWMRRPRHVVTFCTVPFVLVHSAIAHKEERFLFPIAILTLLAAALALEPSTPQSTAARLGAALRAFTRTRAYAVIVGLNFAAMVLLAVYPLGWRPHIPFYRWAEQAMHEPGPVELISANADMVPSYPFYRRKPWQISAGPAAANGPVYEIRSEPFTARPPAHELVYSEFPGWQVPWLRQQIFPKLAELHAWALPRIDKPDRLIWLSAYRVPPP